MPLGEFDLIAKYFQRPVRRADLGVGDDCALITPSAGMQLAISTDLLVEGRHFLSTVLPERLGHKSLAVNLSDLAAMGARPLAFTLSLALPRVDEAFLGGFARGMWALAEQHDVELIGGDTTAGPLAIGITIFGELPTGAALRRDAARVGDDIWVSHADTAMQGSGIGDARLALEAFRGHVALGDQAFEAMRARMECPTPRVALGMALRGVAHAAIDLSDGLSGDLGHILKASGVGATIDVDAMPRSAVLAAQTQAMQRTCLLAGGDDYELAFTAPVSRREAVQQVAQGVGVSVRCIGRIEAQAGLRVVDAAGAPVALTDAAFDHFKS
jgi:thiamine-monophosphate kinase